jgi:hypothetical protein
LNSNQPQLGFLNPLLYFTKNKYPQSFRDITVGDNACGVGLNLNELLCCEYSFSAAPGWDAGKKKKKKNNFYIVKFIHFIINFSIWSRGANIFGVS